MPTFNWGTSPTSTIDFPSMSLQIDNELGIVTGTENFGIKCFEKSWKCEERTWRGTVASSVAKKLISHFSAPPLGDIVSESSLSVRSKLIVQIYRRTMCHNIRLDCCLSLIYKDQETLSRLQLKMCSLPNPFLLRKWSARQSIYKISVEDSVAYIVASRGLSWDG